MQGVLLRLIKAAVELFGAKAGPALAEFCQSGKLNFDELGCIAQ